jgi:hypothetical protein
MKQGKDSLLEISANGEHLTTDLSTHNDDPLKSIPTLGEFTDESAIAQRQLES